MNSTWFHRTIQKEKLRQINMSFQWTNIQENFKTKKKLSIAKQTESRQSESTKELADTKRISSLKSFVNEPDNLDRGKQKGSLNFVYTSLKTPIFLGSLSWVLMDTMSFSTACSGSPHKRILIFFCLPCFLPLTNSESDPLHLWRVAPFTPTARTAYLLIESPHECRRKCSSCSSW